MSEETAKVSYNIGDAVRYRGMPTRIKQVLTTQENELGPYLTPVLKICGYVLDLAGRQNHEDNVFVFANKVDEDLQAGW